MTGLKQVKHESTSAHLPKMAFKTHNEKKENTLMLLRFLSPLFFDLSKGVKGSMNGNKKRNN
ncbi:hypothetical protein [Flammeovirga aprica]|uniref:Uncharacterized protein n=1 Tax=Flammeovirga aprica JL-4 TaxID=694437 RepID=A0A7X9NZB1_9BACT|nr:hypothetical protein [Flammeovirga aprica]NME66608.1 hypothetical protein [Flammeovirga aprica JL-4]